MGNCKTTYSLILNKLRAAGHRITEQQRIVVREILSNQNVSTKELFYLVREKNSNVSQASVYRTVRKLENLGLLQRKSILSIDASQFQAS